MTLVLSRAVADQNVALPVAERARDGRPMRRGALRVLAIVRILRFRSYRDVPWPSCARTATTTALGFTDHDRHMTSVTA